MIIFKVSSSELVYLQLLFSKRKRANIREIIVGVQMCLKPKIEKNGSDNPIWVEIESVGKRCSEHREDLTFCCIR